VEGSVDKIANRIRNMLRDRTFFDFDELNEAIREKLADLNSRPFQKRAGSRDEKFEAAERAALQPLPARPFEIARWGRQSRSPRATTSFSRRTACTTPCRIVSWAVAWRCVGLYQKSRSSATESAWPATRATDPSNAARA
jgi:hypothetical protein